MNKSSNRYRIEKGEVVTPSVSKRFFSGPIAGELVVGDVEVELTPSRAFALIDDHRGYPR
jgi:hypothetical protein